MSLIVRQNVAGRPIGEPVRLDRRRRRLSSVMARHSQCRTRPQVVSVRRRDEPWTVETAAFLPQREWAHTLVGPHDIIIITDLPMGGGGASGGAGAKQIGGAIAMIALAVVAPWAAGALVGAIGLTGFAATAATSALSIGIIAGGAYLVGKATQPKANKSTEDAPVYGVSGGGNQPRPGDRIPRAYGTFWTQPDLTQPDYIAYDGDDQLLFKRVTLGLGKYEIDEIQIGSGAVYATMWTSDGSIQAPFVGAEVEIIPPGGTSTLVPGTVISSPLVQSQVLPGPKDNPDTAGPFAVTGVDARASRIQLDYSLPQGVYSTFTNSKGSQTGPESWGVLFEHAICDEDNNPIGPWVPLWGDGGYQQSTRALRFTKYIDVDPTNRYVVRARDTVGKVDDFNSRVNGAANSVQWDGLRGHVMDTIVRPHVTEIAVKVRSGKALGITAFSEMYVKAKAILPVWDGNAWTEQATNKSVWAYADVLRASYGGNIPDDQIDLARLKFYADELTEFDTFDGVIRGPVSVYEAAATVLGTMRAEPARIGNAWSMTRDEPGTIRKHVFTRRQIVRDSTATNFKLAITDGSADVICEYYTDCDPRRRREVRQTFGETSTTPRRISLTGISSYEHAHHHATWVAAAAYYRRETRSITTEYEGRLVQRGDPALIDAWFMTDGRAAGVLDVQGATVILDTGLDLQPDSYAVFRNRTNREWGPVRVTAGAAMNEIVLNADDVASIEGFYGETLQAALFDDAGDLTSVIIGPITDVSERFIIQTVEPQGRDRVAITAINDHDLIWAALGEAPAPEPPVPGVGDINQPAVPVIPWVSAQATQKATALVMDWSVGPTRNAAQIIVELSYRPDFSIVERVSEGTATGGSYPLSHFDDNDEVSVRAYAVSPAGIIGPTVTTFFTTFKPTINDQWADLAITIASLSAQLQKDIESIAAIGDATIDAGRTTLRGAISDLYSKVEELGNAAATEATNSYSARQTVKVAVDGAMAALDREITLRIDQGEAFASDVETLVAQINDNVAALQTEISTRATADSAEALARTTLASRVTSAETNITGNAQALTQLNTKVTNDSGRIDANSSWLTTLDSRITNAEGVNVSQATAVSQLQTTTTSQGQQISANASSITALSTTVGGHTSTLTQYGASINGVSAKWGVAWDYDGRAVGGIVMTGIVKNDGTGLTQIGILGDLVVSGTIYGDKLAANNIITASAQIGNLIVDNISVKDGAITNSIAASSGGTSAAVGITVRGNGRVTISAVFTGASGNYLPYTTPVGTFSISRDGQQIDAVINNYEASGNSPNTAIAFQATALLAVDQPGAGYHTYTAFTSNGAGIGGIRLVVEELSK